MFADGDKLLRVGSTKKLTLGFMVSRGVICGVLAGLVEVSLKEIDDRYLQEEEEEVVVVVEEEEIRSFDMEKRVKEEGEKKSGEELKEELTYYRRLLGRDKESK